MLQLSCRPPCLAKAAAQAAPQSQPAAAAPRPPAAQQQRRVPAFVAAVVAVALSASPALAADDLVLGAATFEKNCAVCHAGGLNNTPGEEQHTLRKDALEKYRMFSVEGIAAQVVAGKDAMPPFKGTLSEREIRAVAAFVFDQAAGDKW